MRRLAPLLAALVAGGCRVHAFAPAAGGELLRGAGAHFHDLDRLCPWDGIDPQSSPNGVRQIAYAARHTERLRAQVARLAPALVIYDTFALIARVVAHALGLPGINLCAGHNVHRDTLPGILRLSTIEISAECHAALDLLATRFDFETTPFGYATGAGASLNVYGEPPEFLPAAGHAALAPLACYGSLPAGVQSAHRRRRRPRGKLRVYASFGTVIWRRYSAEALAALTAIATAAGALGGIDLTVSLGGAKLDAGARAALARFPITVADYVAQWEVLQDCDLFITHQGLNSTHEAIWHGVPMLSYPFFWDQPGLAARVREFGLATPLGVAPRAPLTADAVRARLEETLALAPLTRQRLAEALVWEQAVLAGRPEVVERVLALAAG